MHGRDGIDALVHTRFALVITDIVMPEQDGIEPIQRIHELDATLPIIAVSGSGTEDFSPLQDAKLMGADRIIGKPFHVEEMLSAVRELLGRDERLSRTGGRRSPSPGLDHWCHRTARGHSSTVHADGYRPGRLFTWPEVASPGTGRDLSWSPTTRPRPRRATGPALEAGRSLRLCKGAAILSLGVFGGIFAGVRLWHLIPNGGQASAERYATGGGPQVSAYRSIDRYARIAESTIGAVPTLALHKHPTRPLVPISFFPRTKGCRVYSRWRGAQSRTAL